MTPLIERFLCSGEAEGEGTPDLAISEYDYGSLDGMKVGPLSAGEIGPFSSTKLEIIWQPTVPGKVDTEFLVTFTDPLSDGVRVYIYLSRLMRKPTICICENKDVDQRLCFRYTDSTLPLLPKSKFLASSSFLCLYRLVCVGPVRKPHCWFSHEAAHLL